MAGFTPWALVAGKIPIADFAVGVIKVYGMQLRMAVTSGTVADCKQACHLMEGIDAEYFLADRAYNSDSIVEKAEDAGMIAVIPPRKNRKKQRDYDKYLI